MANIPKKYMLVLQKKYGGQEALEFTSNGDAIAIPVKVFSDEKLSYQKKKDSKVQKNTLAFYDAITNKFKSFDQLLGIVGRGVYPFDYKQQTSYIGFLNNGFMQKLPISFSDERLAQIALKAKGNSINKQDQDTISIVTDIVDMIEDPSSDFVQSLKDAYDKEDSRFSFSRSFVDDLVTYRSAKMAQEKRQKYSHIMSDELNEDVQIFKTRFLEKVESYRNFREIYRFRKQYLIDKEYRDTLGVIAPQPSKPKERTQKEQKDFEAYCEYYSEVRQKDYPRNKQKSLDDQIPGQMSLFDTPKTR